MYFSETGPQPQEHQIDGASWLATLGKDENYRGGLLGDVMELGKTGTKTPQPFLPPQIPLHNIFLSPLPFSIFPFLSLLA